MEFVAESDDELPDGMMAAAAVTRLEELARQRNETGQPFLLADPAICSGSGGLGLLKHAFDRSHQQLHTNRLGEIGIGADFHPALAVFVRRQ